MKKILVAAFLLTVLASPAFGAARHPHKANHHTVNRHNVKKHHVHRHA